MKVRPATRAGPGARELDPEGEAPAALPAGRSLRTAPCASSEGRLPAPSIIREDPRQCHGFPSQAALLIAGFPESSATLRRYADPSRLAKEGLLSVLGQETWWDSLPRRREGTKVQPPFLGVFASWRLKTQRLTSWRLSIRSRLVQHRYVTELMDGPPLKGAGGNLRPRRRARLCSARIAAAASRGFGVDLRPAGVTG